MLVKLVQFHTCLLEHQERYFSTAEELSCPGMHIL